jgi:hypothetical protein
MIYLARIYSDESVKTNGVALIYSSVNSDFLNIEQTLIYEYNK